MSERVINILVVDDHPIVLDGIRTMLKDEHGFRITGTAKNAAEALLFLEVQVPDIILLDISLPDMDGLELCQKIRAENNTSKIIGLTSFNEAGMITGLLQRGGNGYLLKNMERSELIRAIETVLKGKIFLSEAANESILAQFHNPKAAAEEPLITRREKEILLLLADGLKGPEIAEKLFLSPLTVETHRKNLCKKLNANSVQLLLKVARERGIIG
ncbi:MAG TPA: response regulator transcription factor [Cyclobacteriaceae bacterium]|nr:response regulator transcription factor [Cyclobacteriaceae bacterium]